MDKTHPTVTPIGVCMEHIGKPSEIFRGSVTFTVLV